MGARGALGILLALAALSLAGCQSPPPALSDASPDGGPGQCGPGLKPHGLACLPILDECPENHVPVPGGGCKRVGVEACSIDGQVGIKGPPDWSCQRIGVAECEIEGGPGIKGPPDWTCKRIGPPRKCLAGFAITSDGWCEPVLPEREACPTGTIEVIGQTACQPLGDCGESKWGLAVPDQVTVFVDHAAPATQADGSEKAPFPTIGAALAAALDGGQILIAEGTYTEDLAIDRRVRLRGRCAKLVTVKGSASATIVVKKGGTASELRGLTVSGAGAGISLSGGTKLLMKEVAVLQTEGHGLDVLPGAELNMESSIVAESRGAGVSVQGATAVLRGVVVRHMRSDLEGQGGLGIEVARAEGQAARLELSDSLVKAARENGVLIRSASALIERSVIRDTKNSAAIRTVLTDEGAQPSLELQDSLVASNILGVHLRGTKARAERTVIRDGGSAAIDTPALSAGMSDGGTPSSLLLSDSAIVRNFGWGIYIIQDSDGTIRRSIVADTRATLSTVSSIGLMAQYKATVLVEDSSILRSYHGVKACQCSMTIQRSSIRDSASEGLEVGTCAQGIRSQLNLVDSLVESNARRQLLLTSADASVERTIVRGNRGHPSSYCSAAVQVSTLGPNLRASSLNMKDSLIEGSFRAGLEVYAAEAALSRTIVRDNAQCAQLPCTGWGAVASNLTPKGPGSPASLRLSDSLVDGNRLAGLSSQGAITVLERSVVRDTKPAETCDTYRSADGVNAVAASESDRLTLEDTLVTGNAGQGVALFDLRAMIRRSLIDQTSPSTPDLLGVGISAKSVERSGSLSLEDSRVIGSKAYGVLGDSLEVVIRRSQVRGTLPGRLIVDETSGRGDGIWVLQPSGSPFSGRLELSDSLVQDSARAGLFFDQVAGTVQRSVLRRGAFSILLDNGADPLVGSDNVFELNSEDRVSMGPGLPPVAPIPVPPAPPLPDE